MTESYRESGMPYPAWEYSQDRVEADSLDKTLLQYGNNGWELVAVCRIPTNNDPIFYRLFFKRMR